MTDLQNSFTGTLCVKKLRIDHTLYSTFCSTLVNVLVERTVWRLALRYCSVTGPESILIFHFLKSTDKKQLLTLLIGRNNSGAFSDGRLWLTVNLRPT